MPTTVAELDKANRLIGIKQVKKTTKKDVVVCDEIDLPMDGSYRWHEDQGSFIYCGKYAKWSDAAKEAARNGENVDDFKKTKAKQ